MHLAFHSVGAFFGAVVVGAMLQGRGMPAEQAVVIGALVGLVVGHIIESEIAGSRKKKEVAAEYALDLARADTEGREARVKAAHSAPASRPGMSDTSRPASSSSSEPGPDLNLGKQPKALPEGVRDSPKPASHRESEKWADY